MCDLFSHVQCAASGRSAGAYGIPVSGCHNQRRLFPSAWLCRGCDGHPDSRRIANELKILGRPTRGIPARATAQQTNRCSGSAGTHRLSADEPTPCDDTGVHSCARGGYDAQVLRIAHKLVGITPVHGNKFDAQLRWPLQAGGMGLVSAAEIAPYRRTCGNCCIVSRICLCVARRW